jgi:hypothetical protein
LFNDPPFSGGIGKLVLGGALLTGALDPGVFGPELGGSMLLHAASAATAQSSSATMRLETVLDIFLRIITNRGFVRIAWQRVARHSIFALDPTAQVNKLASLRTEWTKGVVFPLGRFTAGWTLHEF